MATLHKGDNDIIIIILIIIIIIVVVVVVVVVVIIIIILNPCSYSTKSSKNKIAYHKHVA